MVTFSVGNNEHDSKSLVIKEKKKISQDSTVPPKSCPGHRHSTGHVIQVTNITSKKQLTDTLHERRKV